MIKKRLYLAAGWLAFGAGTVGIFLPLLPTVPLCILAAFCFARSSPALEARIMNHPVYGPPIRIWREKGAISRRGKWAATLAFSASILFGFLTLSGHWLLVPPAIAVICLSWIWTRRGE